MVEKYMFKIHNIIMTAENRFLKVHQRECLQL
jgi:hypothetical protein